MIIDSLWFRSTLYLVTALMVSVWLVMLFVTMPHLEALTGGIKVFDMRPLGYGLEDARAIHAGLGEAGRVYYRTVQQGLDSAFPALIFITVSGWQIVLVRKLAATGLRLANWQTGLLIGLNLLGAVADYGENGAVRQVLMTATDMLSLEMVEAANRMTLAKSMLNTLSYLLLLALAGTYVYRRRRR